MATVLLLATLSACGDDGGSDAVPSQATGAKSAGTRSTPDSGARSTPEPDAQFRLPRGSSGGQASEGRQAAARAARAGREACAGRAPTRVLAASIAAAKRERSARDARERRTLIEAAETLPADARSKPAGASLAAALYAIRLPRAERLPARAGCLSALLRSGRSR